MLDTKKEQASSKAARTNADTSIRRSVKESMRKNLERFRRSKAVFRLQKYIFESVWKKSIHKMSDMQISRDRHRTTNAERKLKMYLENTESIRKNLRHFRRSDAVFRLPKYIFKRFLAKSFRTQTISKNGKTILRTVRFEDVPKCIWKTGISTCEFTLLKQNQLQKVLEKI